MKRKSQPTQPSGRGGATKLRNKASRRATATSMDTKARVLLDSWHEYTRRLQNANVDNETVLFFYSQSKQCAPGRGSNERVCNTEEVKRLERELPVDCREKMSKFAAYSFHMCDKVGNLRHFANEEAAYHFGKFDVNGIDASELCVRNMSGLQAKKMGGSKGGIARLDEVQQRRWEMNKRHHMHVMYMACRTQNIESRRILCATGKAVLLHSAGRQLGHGKWDEKTQTMVDRTEWVLMQVRDQLQKMDRVLVEILQTVARR